MLLSLWPSTDVGTGKYEKICQVPTLLFLLFHTVARKLGSAVQPLHPREKAGKMFGREINRKVKRRIKSDPWTRHLNVNDCDWVMSFSIY